MVLKVNRTGEPGIRRPDPGMLREGGRIAFLRSLAASPTPGMELTRIELPVEVRLSSGDPPGQ